MVCAIGLKAMSFLHNIFAYSVEKRLKNFGLSGD
jgi:hypothetical protein